MKSLLRMCKVSARWYSFLLGSASLLGLPSIALAQTPLTQARVETLRNRVHLIPSGRRARRARVSDLMSIGDALRTSTSARAELRFNDGSLARVGEQATFRFTPDTRNFQLSNGTVLLLIPPGQGRTTIQTPNAVTGIQGSALFVRVHCVADGFDVGQCASPVTIVGALTNNSAGAMMAFNGSGNQQQALYAGEMVIIEGDTITESLEFDLRTFYQTSGLAKGLDLDSETPPASLSDDLHDVWLEIQDALELQGNFDEYGSSEQIVVNPEIVTPAIANVTELELEGLDVVAFSGFPSFESSPAAVFHSSTPQITATTLQPARGYAPDSSPVVQSESDNTNLTAPITSSRAARRFDNNRQVVSNPSVSNASEPIARPLVVGPSADSSLSIVDSGLSNIPGDTSSVDSGLSVVNGGPSTIPDSTLSVDSSSSIVDSGLSNIPGDTSSVDSGLSVVNGGPSAIPDNTLSVDSSASIVDSGVSNIPADSLPSAERAPADSQDFGFNVEGATDSPPDDLPAGLQLEIIDSENDISGN
ncbi:MAG: FecR family protein [Cyanobacteria bacterium P01_D01_bin.156]